MKYIHDIVIGICLLAVGFVIGFYTPFQKECFMHWEGLKPVYSLNCIMEEAKDRTP